MLVFTKDWLFIAAAIQRGKCKHTHLGETHSNCKSDACRGWEPGFDSTQRAAPEDRVGAGCPDKAITHYVGSQDTVKAGMEGGGLWNGVGR